MDSEVLSSIVALHGKVDDLTTTVLTMDCKVNNNRINNLEKVVYGAVKLILVAFIVGVIGILANSFTGSNSKADANMSIQKKASIHKNVSIHKVENRKIEK